MQQLVVRDKLLRPHSNLPRFWRGGHGGWRVLSFFLATCCYQQLFANTVTVPSSEEEVQVTWLHFLFKNIPRPLDLVCPILVAEVALDTFS